MGVGTEAPVRSPATPLLRLGHALAFAGLLDQIGAPVERLLERSSLPVGCNNPDEFVPTRHAWAFFADSARREEPLLGWHTGRFVGDKGLNADLLRRLQSSPTIYAALKRLIDLASSEASHVDLRLMERGDEVLICTQYPDLRGEPGYEQSQTYQLGLLADLCRRFIEPDWVPARIGVEQPFVTKEERDHLGGTRVLARQPVGYLAVPRRYMFRAARAPGKAQNVIPVVLASDFNFVDTLRALLRAYVGDGYPSAQTAADLMHTSTRTLARRLADHDLTYGVLVDGVRFEIARDLLRETDEKVIDVAAAVGFGDPSHFTRMFRRIAGVTPSEFRKAERPAA